MFAKVIMTFIPPPLKNASHWPQPYFWIRPCEWMNGWINERMNGWMDCNATVTCSRLYKNNIYRYILWIVVINIYLLVFVFIHSYNQYTSIWRGSHPRLVLVLMFFFFSGVDVQQYADAAPTLFWGAVQRCTGTASTLSSESRAAS